MQHRYLFVNSLLPHLKYPLRQQKLQSQGKDLQEALQLEEKQYKHTYPTMEKMKKYLKNLTLQLNQKKGKENREDVWCTMCRIESNDKNECPLFSQYIGVGMPNPLALGGPWCEI